MVTARVALYARVSTSDRTRILRLSSFHSGSSSRRRAGRCPESSSIARRRPTCGGAAWRDLLDRAARRQLDVILVWRIDRAFRSVLDAATTLERLRGWGVGLRSYSEPWLDTTSPFGEALYYITAAYAHLERGILRERVRAGMDRARKQGKRLGRPQKVNGEWDRIGPDVRAGRLTRPEAAHILGVSDRTVYRLLRHKGGAE